MADEENIAWLAGALGARLAGKMPTHERYVIVRSIPAMTDELMFLRESSTGGRCLAL